MSAIPIVDVSKIGLGSETACTNDLEGKCVNACRENRAFTLQKSNFNLDVGKELHAALSRIGFVSLTGHGINAATVRSVFSSSKKFFEELSAEEKLGYPQTEDKKQGYVSPGKEMLDNLKVGVGNATK